MKVLIIEDEQLAAERMVELLNLYDKSIEIIETFDSVKDSVQWLTNTPQPDLIFMDIQLADGLCFDIFEQVVLECPVIFTTAYEEYAIKAFKVNSVDYLLKPIDFSELKNSIEKFQKHFQISNQPLIIHSDIIQNVKKLLSRPSKNRFVIKVGEHLKSVSTDDILYFFSQEKTTNIFTSKSKKFIVDYSLDHLKGLLDDEKFFRISRKYIINRDAISDIIVYSKSRLKVKLINQEEDDLIVSRDKVNAFKKWLDE
ncbi:MAG: response regulator transcription factor [Prolixibacteraceae bacterium]|jgi:DNA-binding LytR/AlgR family response regulator|nr:response regulator transcription factor [Prolixibacteraceae bacterium]MBT6004227.1 response regulator transcription factor [Prolixibacteraceae bacterium]MBT6766997.1 response regulator transcription factor [Prolixibacteraceae bacterium]MBT7000324.1 response regulator transcription factor [Prolixibacteraceae bacterium]MBT7393876.1 response regulator transcription factor [Prolixibacteraceae bacterium]